MSTETTDPPGEAPGTTSTEPTPPESGSKFWFNDTDSEGNFNETWRDLLPEHLREEKSLQDFRKPDQIAEAYIATKAMVGKAANSILLPQSMEGAGEEDIANLRKLVGAPEDAAGYDLKRPEGMSEGQWSDEQAGAFAELLSKHNAPNGLAQELLAFDAQRQAMAAENAQKDHEAFIKTEQENLKQLWGANYEERVKDALDVWSLDGAINDDDPIHSDPRVVKKMAGLAKHFKQDELRGARAAIGGSKTNADKARSAMTDPNDPLYSNLQGDNGEEAQELANAQVQEWLQEPAKF